MSSYGCPDSNNLSGPRFQVCLIGESLKENDLLIKSIEKFGFPIVQSSNGLEYINQGAKFTTIYILDEFEGEIYNTLDKAGQRILGPSTLIHYAEKNEPLPNISRPLYTASMKNLVISFTGFRVKEELTEMVALIHHMGGLVRKNFSVSKTTHLIANTTFGEKYRVAAALSIPVMTSQWVYEVWDRRHDPSCIATNAEFMPYTLLPFVGCKISLRGYHIVKEQIMIQVISRNGGEVVNLTDSSCTHIVVEDGHSVTASDYSQDVYIVKNEWFWACISLKAKAEESIYKFENMPYTLLPFVGCKISLRGYHIVKEQIMIQVISRNGGEVVNPTDSSCTHIVVEDGHSVTASDYSQDVYIVKNEWFWACISLKAKEEESIYKFENPSAASSSQVLSALDNRFERPDNDFPQLTREFLRTTLQS